MLSGDEQDQVVQDADDVAARVKSARSATNVVAFPERD
jgi:hypothetical protein